MTSAFSYIQTNLKIKNQKSLQVSLLIGIASDCLVCHFLQVSSQSREEIALSRKAWPAPAFSGLSPSPVWLCRLCVTEDERRAAGTSSAASPRCAACTAFPLRGTCPVWRKANLKLLCATPAACSRHESRPLCTRRISFRGAGTPTACHNVRLLRHR